MLAIAARDGHFLESGTYVSILTIWRPSCSLYHTLAPQTPNSLLSRFTPTLTRPACDPPAPSPRAKLCNLAGDQAPQHLDLPLIRLHLQRLQPRPIPPPLIHAIHDRKILQHLPLRHRTQRPDLAVLKRPQTVSALTQPPPPQPSPYVRVDTKSAPSQPRHPSPPSPPPPPPSPPPPPAPPPPPPLRQQHPCPALRLPRRDPPGRRSPRSLSRR